MRMMAWFLANGDCFRDTPFSCFFVFRFLGFHVFFNEKRGILAVFFHANILEVFPFPLTFKGSSLSGQGLASWYQGRRSMGSTDPQRNN
jgi:hypothetical protein